MPNWLFAIQLGASSMCSVLRGIALLLLMTAATALWGKDRLLPADATARIRATRTVEFADNQRFVLKGLFNSRTGAPVEVQGGFEGERIPQADREAMLRFIGGHPAQFHVAPGELDMLASGQIRHKSYLTARQKIDGRPVLGTRVQLRVHANGRVLMWGADVVESAATWRANLSPAAAANALKICAGDRDDGSGSHTGSLVSPGCGADPGVRRAACAKRWLYARPSGLINAIDRSRDCQPGRHLGCNDFRPCYRIDFAAQSRFPTRSMAVDIMLRSKLTLRPRPC